MNYSVYEVVDRYEQKASDLLVGIQGRNANANTPSNMLTTNNMLSLQTNMSKDIKQQLAIKKLRVNSEEKLMAKKVEDANNAKYTKTMGNKYVKLGSDKDEKSSARGKIMRNTTQLLTSNGSQYSNNKDPDQSSDKYMQAFKNKKKSVKSSQRRVGSPVTDTNEVAERADDDAYYEKDNNSIMPRKKLRLNSDNNRNEHVMQYPFPLTPLDKASNKPVDFDENMAAMKSQSTRNK